jgi:glycosyltransferase involved in cell wall biosynthesis
MGRAHPRGRRAGARRAVKLVVITQRVDPDDPALGATVPMLRALAARVDELAVLTLVARPADLPANVRMRTIAAPTQVLRGVRLAAALAAELRPRPAAVVAHMSPIYAVLSAPLARPLGVPVLLWFTHWRRTRLLELAERVSTRVLSVDRSSFPLASRKLIAVGHGIDVDALTPAARREDGVLRVLALGRTSPAKGLATIVEATALLTETPLSLEIRGPSLTAEEVDERRTLERLIAARGLGDRVAVEEPVPRREIGRIYAGVDLLVNNMRAGALDKVVYEAAGAALPTLVASGGFESLVGGIKPSLRFDQDDPQSLAAGLRALAAAGPEERRRIGLELRERVRRDHSTDHWADAVLAAIP